MARIFPLYTGVDSFRLFAMSIECD